MAKTTTRTRSARTQLGGGVRGRDAEFPNTPIHVTGGAQAKIIDINGRQFEFNRTEGNELSERPSTSGGPASNLSKGRNAEKKETKDDLLVHFNPPGAHATGTTFYNFPLPGSVATPRTSSPPIRTSSLPRSDTPDSMAASSTNLNVPQMEIGMALGSPTHPPNALQSQSPMVSSIRNETPDSVETYVDNDAHVAAPSKQKASKWKIFGGLFGGSKKNAGSSQAFYQLQPEGAVVQATVEADYGNFGEPVGTCPQRSKSRGRGRTNSERKNDKHKPGLKRAQTAPLNFDSQDSNNGNAMTGAPTITLDGGPLNVHPAKTHAHGGLLLDVDIPSVQMERYSIMFGSLLQKPTASSSSLLARRQATLDRLKTVNEALALKEQELEEKAKQLRPRRASSPQPTKSPAFSLFPSTPSRLTVNDGSLSPNRRYPHQRSNTSPAALSPSRPAFAPGPDNETHANLMAPGPHVPMISGPQDEIINRHRRDLNPSKRTAEPLQNPQSSTRNWSSEQSHLTLDSPSSEAEEEDIYDPTLIPMKPKLDEPTWQIINPQHAHVPASSISGSTSSSSDHSTSTSASSISTTSIAPFTTSNLKTVKMQAPPPRLRSRSATTASIVTHPFPRWKDSEASLTSPSLSASSAPKKSIDIERSTEQEDLEERLRSAAEVSIARQISVSRQQRQLLIPITANGNPNLTSKYKQSLSPLNTINMTRVASPLGAVASAAQAESPIDRHGRPERKGSKSAGVNERLVAASVNPSTPTLVVVGDGEKEKMWGGKAVEQPRVSNLSTGSGDIMVGLSVESREIGRSRLGPGEGQVHGHMYRKSERVVVERVSVASSS